MMPTHAVARVLAVVARQRGARGRDAQEMLSEAGERIARVLAAGRLPTDPAALEALLLKEAGRGAKAAEARECRHRRKFRTGVTTAEGRPVLDLVPAPEHQDPPLSNRAGKRGQTGPTDLALNVREALASGKLVAADLRDAVLVETLGAKPHRALLAECGVGNLPA